MLVILASGCAENTGTSTGKGLVINDFSISDNTLRPNQEANLQVTLQNYHERPTTINNISIFNEGELTVDNKQCTSDDIREARDGLYPQLSCSWTVKAPGEDFIAGFDSKKTPLKLRLNYSTQFENQEPLKVNFKELSEIERSESRKISFGNGEVKLQAETESPAALSKPQPVKITVQNKDLAESMETTVLGSLLQS